MYVCLCVGLLFTKCVPSTHSICMYIDCFRNDYGCISSVHLILCMYVVLMYLWFSSLCIIIFSFFALCVLFVIVKKQKQKQVLEPLRTG
jgi:hypothetical protein